MYRRELEEDGLVVDPLKAVHQIRGATAHEMAHHFWSPDVRFEWESKLFIFVLLMIYNHTLLEYLLSTIPHPRRIYRHTYRPRKRKIAPNNPSYYHR